jgi:hypothetical protein
MINFVFDQPQSIYPNLTQLGLQPGDFDRTAPYTTQLRLINYFNDYNISWQACNVHNAPNNSWYPIGFSWFDFTIDYLVLIPHKVKRMISLGKIKILFYYHEADSPGRIKSRLDFLGIKHSFPEDYYLFVSGNTSAEYLPNFLYFSDLELFFKFLNRSQQSIPDLKNSRPYEFTALSRTHKLWRSTVIADLHRCNLLNNSLWSYNTDCYVDNDSDQSPIIVREIKGLSEYCEQFVNQGPYFCDTDNTDMHNNHTQVNTDLYYKSYCHIVIETLFDADQSGGSFITEKTYKAIKYGQPFVIVGTVGSLETLRRAGYRTFDHAIDNSYDLIHDNTQRWLAVRNAIEKIQSGNMHAWFESCQDDILYNQQHYQCRRPAELDNLVNLLSYKP